ncbi:GNAT family N-acetyltransferase, partial [Candidatus Pacearchaeota archaeon]|nr:GNAT family N-acetyltransferase [Candidatus Pacearchaeota archaeon]
MTQKYVAWLNDPDVVRFSEQRHRRHTFESCKGYIDSFKGTANYIWAISVNDDDIGHIGNISAHVNKNNNTADIGILIGEKRVWGKGYGKESWSVVCSYLMKNRGIRKITGGALSTNIGMLRVMKKAGMTEDGRRIRQCLWEDQEVDIVHM